MAAKRAGGVLALTLSLATGGCTTPPAPAPAPAAVPTRPAAAVRHTTYPVGLRVLPLRRNSDRPLVTLVFFPAATTPDEQARPWSDGPWTMSPTAPPPGSPATPPAGRQTVTTGDAGGAGEPSRVSGAGGVSRAGGRSEFSRRIMRQVSRHGTLDHGTLGARPADGRFPLVLFSHGLSGSPEWCAPALAAWASTGFVVVAPTFPYTSEFARDYRREDVANQPDDLRHVLHQVRRLGNTPGDPLHGRIDGDRVAAVGHSAGGYTTTGLFTAGHDPRLRAGVVLAGWSAPGAFAGPPAAMLFVQGTADPVVPVAVSRAAFDRVPWPRSYLLLRRLSHADYLRPDQSGYARVTATVTAFLRWTLTGDEAARLHLPPVLPPAADTPVG